MNMKGILIGIFVLIVLAGGAFALTNKKSSDNSTSNTTASQPASNNSDTTNSAASTTTADSAETITYSDSGFSPSTLTVSAGTTVTVKNTSSRDMQFDSDPHPAHTDDTELNVGIVAPGKSMTFKVTTAGTHGYHNHLNPGDTGTIIVK